MTGAIVPLAPPAGDALADLTDQQLWNTQLLLDLVCTRFKSGTTRQRRQYFCYLARVLKVEADLRGLPSPSSDSRLADLYRA